jgi:hypothetical protein
MMPVICSALVIAPAPVVVCETAPATLHWLWFAQVIVNQLVGDNLMALEGCVDHKINDGFSLACGSLAVLGAACCFAKGKPSV